MLIFKDIIYIVLKRKYIIQYEISFYLVILFNTQNYILITRDTLS